MKQILATFVSIIHSIIKSVIDNICIFVILDPNNGPIDYKKLLKDELLNASKDKITVNLPTIVKENSIIHKSSPFTFSDKDISGIIRSTAIVEVSVCLIYS